MKWSNNYSLCLQTLSKNGKSRQKLKCACKFSSVIWWCFWLTFFHYFHENECVHFYLWVSMNVGVAPCDQNSFLVGKREKNEWMNEWWCIKMEFVCVYSIFFAMHSQVFPWTYDVMILYPNKESTPNNYQSHAHSHATLHESVFVCESWKCELRISHNRFKIGGIQKGICGYVM